MLPLLQRSSPPNPLIGWQAVELAGLHIWQPAKLVNALTVLGNTPGAPALVIWAVELVQALNLSILMFAAPPFPPVTYTTYRNPLLSPPTATLGKSEPASRANGGAQLLAGAVVALLSGEQVTLATPFTSSLKAI